MQQILLHCHVLRREGIEVTVEEALGSAFDKAAQKCVAARVGNVRVAGKALPFHHCGGVVERTDHAGDVAQPVILFPSQRHRFRWLAFEVDDVNIAIGDQHLTEMKVAMDAGH